MYGLKVHEAALAEGVKVTGATVHFVNEIPDGGRDPAAEGGGGPARRHAGDPAAPGHGAGGVEAAAPGGGSWSPEHIVKEKESRILETDSEPCCGAIPIPAGASCWADADGKPSSAYFIMGRSANSRNRVFVETEDGIRTEAS